MVRYYYVLQGNTTVTMRVKSAFVYYIFKWVLIPGLIAIIS